MSVCNSYPMPIREVCYLTTLPERVSNGMETMSQSVIDGAVQIVDGTVKGITDSINNTWQNFNSTQYISPDTFKGMGAKIGKVAYTEGWALAEEIFGKDFPAKMGNATKKAGKDFFKELDLDPEQTASDIGTKARNTNKAFLDGLNTKKIFEDLGKAFDDGVDGFDLSGRAGNVGSEFKNAMNDFSREFAEGLGDAAREIMTELRNEYIFNQLPYFLAAGLLTITVTLGTPLFLRYLFEKAKYNIGRPKLATETREITLFHVMASPLGKLLSLFKAKPIKPIYHPDLQRRITNITKAINNVRKNNGYCPNIGIYGEGGTGKTMISLDIAKGSGLSYIKISGGDLAQYIKRGEHVTELNKIFNKMETPWRPWAPWRSIRPWFLFIDEAESLCKDRNKITKAELLELQNAFLNRTGTQTKKFALGLATNRMQDLDPAVKNRLDYKVYIGPPAVEQRMEIIEAYLPQFFSKKERKEIFTKEIIAQIAQDTEGFTGRSLFKLLNAIANKKAATDNNVLLLEDVLQTVKDFIDQEKEVSKHSADAQLPPALDTPLPPAPAPIIIKTSKKPTYKAARAA